VELDSIQNELKSFRAEIKVLLSRFRWGWPAECALLKAFGGTPHTGAVEVKQFEASVGFVDEEVYPSITKLKLEVIFHDGAKAIEALT
jgi:hypothetical protein